MVPKLWCNIKHSANKMGQVRGTLRQGPIFNTRKVRVALTPSLRTAEAGLPHIVLPPAVTMERAI